MFYLQDPAFVLFGASPESALKFAAANRQVEIYPIAGTRKRGFNAQGQLDRDLDSRIELELRQDEKEKAEHLMLVDLARNDVARISVPGSRYVKELLKVDRYSYVMHLVSRVVGTLKTELDAAACLSGLYEHGHAGRRPESAGGRAYSSGRRQKNAAAMAARSVIYPATAILIAAS